MKRNEMLKVQFLIDSGSTINVLTERVCRLNGLMEEDH